MLINRLFYEFLIKKDLITDSEKYQAMLNEANEKSLFFYDVLIEKNVASEVVIYQYLAAFYEIDFLEANTLALDSELIRKVQLHYLKELKVMPLKISDKTLVVAISQPANMLNANQLEKYYKLPVKCILVTPSNLNTLFEYIENKSRKSEVIRNEQAFESDISLLDDELHADSPAVRLAEILLREATALNASDIHLEPFFDSVRVRYRIDGHLSETLTISKMMYQSVLARFKIISGLNIAERRRPQNGQLKIVINGNEYEFRVSTIPTIHGEKIVIRVYLLEASNQEINQLGFSKEQLKSVMHMIERKHGIILVTGPTGSGKSTTLYAFLKALNKKNLNITTVEDPVENKIEGINQIQVNPKAGVTFQTALRAILRQDPNVIMVGEIRDEETAQMAVRAAITGHLVFSTLHTNDAIGSVTRLMDMEIPRYLLSDSIVGAIAQRLVRKLCPYCKKEVSLTEFEKKHLGLSLDYKVFKPVGCGECNSTGYRGRQAVFEVVVADNKLKRMIEDKQTSIDDIRDKVENDKTKLLLDSCLQLVLDGVTSVDEYNTLIQFEYEKEE